jgi:hypothetical protein
MRNDKRGKKRRVGGFSPNSFIQMFFQKFITSEQFLLKMFHIFIVLLNTPAFIIGLSKFKLAIGIHL